MFRDRETRQVVLYGSKVLAKTPDRLMVNLIYFARFDEQKITVKKVFKTYHIL